MQLVAYGSQDIYLTGNPQITYFKMVYRRYTNFAMESIIQPIDGDFNFDRNCSCTIARNGDLIHKIYVEVEYSSIGQGFQNSAFELIDEVQLEIGGQLIDRQYGEWMNIWCELTHSESKWKQLQKIIEGDVNKTKQYIPLQFNFCRDIGVALPLIALQYHEVKISFRVTQKNTGSSAEIKQACVYVDYIYLDSEERRRFAQNTHEYLIEQTQSNTDLGIEANCMNRYELNFNHPVKELIWVHNKEDPDSKFVYNESTEAAIIKLNGHDRLDKRQSDYFRDVQRYQHHTGSEKAGHPIYVYSFALNPEEHQPSGTCNFSRIDNALLEIDAKASASGTTNIYAVNYNVLRIMSGMGGLAYSN